MTGIETQKHTPAGIEIAPMTMEHYDGAYALWAGSLTSRLDVTDTPEGVKRYLDRNPGMSHVALCGGRVVGTVLCGHDGRRGFIHHMAVDAGHRRKGIARAMADAALAALFSDGIEKCNILVFERNEGGKAAWDAMGWKKRDDLCAFSVVKGREVEERTV